MRLILTVLAVFIVLVLNEVLWRRRKAPGEFSRKFVHVTLGSFAAFWPFFLSWRQIEWLSVALVAGVGLSKTFKIFNAIHSVQRPTWGEMCFALSVGIIALTTHDKWIYTASILTMGLADGLAAVAGVRFGRSNSYTVMGHSKSMAGTLVFFVSSVLILLGYSHFSHSDLALAKVFGISILASLLENASVRGLDNLLVPVLVALALR